MVPRWPTMEARRARTLAWVTAAALAVGMLTGCNLVHRQRDRIRKRLTEHGMREQVVQLGADRVSYWDSGGTGQVVLLVHGFGMPSLWQWHEQVPALLPARRVVMPDLLWFGASSSKTRDFSLDHQVAAVVALLDHLKIHQVDAVGLSYGGFVAYALTAAQPARVRSVTLVDSAGPAFQPADNDALRARLGVKDLADVLIPQTPAAVDRLMELAYADPRYVPDFVARQVIADSYTRNRSELRGLLAYLDQHGGRLSAEAPRIRTPLCLIWGSGDTIMPVALMDRLQGFAQGPSKRHVIENARHAPNAEHPEVFNRALNDCLGGSWH
ncbi:MAG TPA: alpha/beta hydrolase [Polyangia bacterium]